MNTQLVQNILVGLVVVGFLLYRQLTTTSLRTDRGPRAMIILGAVGLYQVVAFAQHGGRIAPVVVGAMMVSLVLAAVLSVARTFTVKLWRTDAGWMRRGTPLTLVLWLVSIGSHLGIDALGAHLAPAGQNAGGLGQATLLLYLAVSIGLQNVLLTKRVAQLEQGSHSPAAPGTW